MAPVHELAGERIVFVGEASSLIYPPTGSTREGHGGTFVEAHQLDAKTAEKITKGMIGRVRSAREASVLLKKIG